MTTADPTNGRPAAEGRGTHAHAVLTALATLFLIFVGGLVKSHEAGLAVPDWPTTYGENMLVYPYSKWVGGLFYEHGHRLTATGVGLLMLLLALRLGLGPRSKSVVRWGVRLVCAALYLRIGMSYTGERLGMALLGNTLVLLATEALLRGPREERAWVRNLGWIALAAVCVQGVLGGLTVRYLLPLAISAAHACLAQAFLAMTVVLAVVTAPGWIEAEPRLRGAAGAREGGLQAWHLCALTAGVVYLQLVLGALMRHMEAGLAIPDFPLAFGRLVPPMDSAGIAIHYAHRVWALAVTASVLATAGHVLRRPRAGAELKALAGLLLALLGTQLTLGASILWTRRAPVPTSFHVATGAAVLATSVLLGLRAYQKLAPGRNEAAAAGAQLLTARALR